MNWFAADVVGSGSPYQLPSISHSHYSSNMSPYIYLCPCSFTSYYPSTLGIAVSFTQEVFRSSSEAGVLEVCINVPNDFQYERNVIYQLQVLPGGTAGQTIQKINIFSSKGGVGWGGGGGGGTLVGGVEV